MTNYTFDKTKRLLNAEAYKAVFDDAQLKVSTQQILFLARPNGLAYSRLGLVIAKKNVRLATQRNRIKRILRDSFRLLGNDQACIDIVVLARKGLDQLDNSALHSLIDQLWQKLYTRAERRLSKQSHA